MILRVAGALGWLALLPLAASAGELELSLDLDPWSGRLDGLVRVELHGAGDTEIRLGSGFTITRLTVDGDPQAVGAGGHVVTVTAPGGAIELAYSGHVALATAADFAAMPTAPLLSPEGSWLPPAGWWPRIDGHGGGWRLTVRVPAGQVAVATASLVEETADDDGYTATFVGDEPPMLFVGPYEIAERDHRGLRLRTYFPAEATDLAEAYLTSAATFIDGFAATIGPYAFDHFWIVAAPYPVGLGFPGATYVGARILPMPFMRGRSLAHEVLHNWWGNGVRVDHASGNWSEGLTTYLADYALAEAAGAAVAREMRLGWLRDISALGDGADTVVAHFTTRHHAAAQVVGYAKVAMLFHMLRREIGDDAFAGGLAALWRQRRGQAAGWDDLRAVFEARSGRDLGGFFTQWLTRPGAPSLRLAEASAESAGDGWRLALRLVQDEPPWALTVPLSVAGEAGGERHLLRIVATVEDHRLEVASRPLAVVVDPDYHLLRRLAPGEAPPIFRDATLDDAIRVVVAGDVEATALASRLLEREVTPRRGALPARGNALLIGLEDAVAEILAAAGEPRVPDSIAGAGTARAWVAWRADGSALMVVAAADAAALAATVGPLPHYGGRGYVVFDGRRAIDQGTWRAAGDHPLRRRLSQQP